MRGVLGVRKNRRGGFLKGAGDAVGTGFTKGVAHAGSESAADAEARNDERHGRAAALQFPQILAGAGGIGAGEVEQADGSRALGVDGFDDFAGERLRREQDDFGGGIAQEPLEKTGGGKREFAGRPDENGGAVEGGGRQGFGLLFLLLLLGGGAKGLEYPLRSGGDIGGVFFLEQSGDFVALGEREGGDENLV